jgi:hypothetical protein
MKCTQCDDNEVEAPKSKFDRCTACRREEVVRLLAYVEEYRGGYLTEISWGEDLGIFFPELKDILDRYEALESHMKLKVKEVVDKNY